MNRRLAALSAVAVVLGGYLAWQNVAPQQQAAPESDAPAVAAVRQPGVVTLNPLQGLDGGSFTGILERPLFNPGRRPRPPEPEPEPMPEPVVEQAVEQPPPPQGPGPQDYVLLGVASGPDGRIAALRIAASGEVVYLRQGEAIDSWSVIEVGDRSVAIGTAESPVTFRMFTADSAAGTPGEDMPIDPPAGEPLPNPLPAGVQ